VALAVDGGRTAGWSRHAPGGSGSTLGYEPAMARPRALPFVLLPLAVAAAYGPSLRNELVWDDRIHIVENPAVREARWREILAEPIGSYYRPVVFAAFALETQAAGDAPALFHASNLSLHALVALLLFAAARAVGAGRGVALSGSLLFALHPVNSEAVLYVSGRTDVLAAAFGLAALLFHGRAARWRGAAVLPGARLGAAISFALALGCKESAAALPLALAAGDRILAPEGSRSARAALRSLAPYALVLAAYAGWRASLGGEGPTLAAPDSWPAQLAAALAALASYARLLVVPVGLHLERFVSAEPGWRPVAGLLVLALGVAAAWRAGPAIRFWMGWAACAYLPTSNLLPIYPGLPSGTVFAPEHFLYLPSTGLGLALALAAAPRLHPRVAQTALAALLVAYAATVHDRARDWRDEETLYAQTLAWTPGSARVRLNLGNLQFARGDAERAAAEFAEGLAHHPDDPDLLTNAGIAWISLGEFAAAERALRRVVELEGEDAQAWANLGALYGRTRRFDEARRAYSAALARDPENRDARAGMRMLEALAPPVGSALP
jgi:tetratricopeptide (TPR) repeat protein